jgi:NTP pyrophosphatase (non-canonical NTP hydrolase)
MKFSEFEAAALTTALYDDKYRVMYPALGLAGETGEVLEKIKKVYRDNDGRLDSDKVDAIAKEIGDVLWYVAALCRDLDITMDDVAESVLAKLRSRAERNALRGSGDER